MHCAVCDLLFEHDDQACPNYWCHREDRGFESVWAVGPHQGRLRRAIAGLKYRAEWWQADWLGSVLADYLLDRAPCFDDVAVIVGVPGNVGKARPVDHVVRILAAARPRVGGLWAMDVGMPVMTKRVETRPMVGTSSAQLRRLWAAGELRAALVVARPGAVEGRRVLAVDDVFTDGSTLREVARALRLAGAAAVDGLVLARQPLRSRAGPRGGADASPGARSARSGVMGWTPGTVGAAAKPDPHEM